MEVSPGVSHTGRNSRSATHRRMCHHSAARRLTTT
ncbi:hypothetical protein IEO21_03823 [Rhodonia placenta]|uniref:Uncharacterized protein n=1 Tax=Rhodonia placenta TaxID=104341 RepID=A0A8H7U3J5_9APHY|nr:hypothetical protein IEO21_03823 [Postia placenta]